MSDSQTISISNFNFHPNQRQKFFSDPKGGPFYVKKIFVSDFAKILYVRSQGHKDQKFWVSSKSESKNFFDPKGPSISKKKLSLILLKIGVNDCETISISYFNFHPNRRQIFFSDPKGGPFYVKNILFWISLKRLLLGPIWTEEQSWPKEQSFLSHMPMWPLFLGH